MAEPMIWRDASGVMHEVSGTNPLPMNSGPAANAVAINLGSDTTLASTSRGIWVGGGGNVKVDLAITGTAIVFTSVPSGTMLPVQATKVYSTANGTTATSLTAVW